MKGILEERGRVNGRLFLLMRFVFPAKNVIRSTMYEIVFTVKTWDLTVTLDKPEWTPSREHRYKDSSDVLFLEQI